MTSSASNTPPAPKNHPWWVHFLGTLFGLFVQTLGALNTSLFLLVIGAIIVLVALFGPLAAFVGGSRRKQAIAIVVVALLMGFSAGGGYLLARQNAPSEPSSNQTNLFARPENWNVFESDATFNTGAPVDTSSVRLQLPNTSHGSGYSLQIKPDVALNYDIVYNQPIVNVDVISADVYIPVDERLDYRRQWVAIQMVAKSGWAVSGTSVEFGKWTRLTLDLRSQYDDQGLPLHQATGTLRVVYSLVGKPGSSIGNVLVGLDNVTTYQGTGVLSTNEQIGSGQVWFGFENQSTQGWQIGVGRDGIDSLSSVSAPTYRGGWALEIQTNGVHEYDAASAKIKIPQFSAYGVWIAHVFIPSNASVELWANMFTYLEEGDNFAAAEPTLLRKGVWTTLIWDTRELPIMTSDAVIGIEVGTTRGIYQGPIYIDDVVIYQK